MRRGGLLLALAGLAGLSGCGADSADLSGEVGLRSGCPDATWTDFVRVEPDPLVAGGTDALLLSWQVFDAAEAPVEAELTASSGLTAMVLTVPLVLQETGFGTALYEASTPNPFGAALAGTTIDVHFRGARPRGCARGPEASTSVPLTGP